MQDSAAHHCHGDLMGRTYWMDTMSLLVSSCICLPLHPSGSRVTSISCAYTYRYSSFRSNHGCTWFHPQEKYLPSTITTHHQMMVMRGMTHAPLPLPPITLMIPIPAGPDSTSSLVSFIRPGVSDQENRRRWLAGGWDCGSGASSLMQEILQCYGGCR